LLTRNLSNSSGTARHGEGVRDRIPRAEHERWATAPHRSDPVSLILESGEGRIQELLPIPHGRMAVSPLTFYRGTADIMAADLGPMPAFGLRAQLCGDCYLMNLGGFATAERRIIFDINDFDETAPGPCEWDVKCLAASLCWRADPMVSPPLTSAMWPWPVSVLIASTCGSTQKRRYLRPGIRAWI
jgi:hypothetical protein